MSAAEKDGKPVCAFSQGFVWKRYSVPELVKIMHRSSFQDWGQKVSAVSRSKLGPDLERRGWFSGRQLQKSLIKHVFMGMGLTPVARACIQHVTTWDPELAIACMELNSAAGESMPVCMYVGTGWSEKNAVVCKNVLVAMKDELGLKVEKGQYALANFDAAAQEPANTSSRPMLNETLFTLTRVRQNTWELAILESELEKARLAYSIDVNLRKLFDDTVVKFNKENNPSGVPWKTKRPFPEGNPLAATAEKESCIFLTPATITVADLTEAGAYIFSPPESRSSGVDFKLIIPADGSKLFLSAEGDGTLHEPLGRFMGTFASGQPAKTLKTGGTQWIVWKINNLDTKVVARKRDSSMAGPDLAPAYTTDPATLKEFITHLEMIGKARFNMVTHKFDRSENGKVIGIACEDCVVLPLPTAAPKKKTLSLDNIAGYIDIDIIKKSTAVQIMHSIVCPGFDAVSQSLCLISGSRNTRDNGATLTRC
jgi:hypothetical protein